MKKIALICSLLFVSNFVFSQIAPKKPESKELSWRILENAQVAFDNGKYGEAINLANKARENRKKEIDWELYVLDTALSPLAVRKAGELFPNVLEVLKERDENEAINLINKYLNLYSSERFDDSVYKLIAWLKSKKVYPEADFLIGRVYQLEGEYKVAYDFYERARTEREYLDIPNNVYDILYALSDLAKETGKKEEYEQALLVILDNDKNFKNSGLHNAFIKIIETNKPENVDKFFLLFRAPCSDSVRAMFEIGNLYADRNEEKRALICSSLISIESITHVYEFLREHDSSFEYTTLSDFLQEAGKYDEIIVWGQKNHVWESIYLMAERIEKRGQTKFAEQLYKIIAESMPDSYYKAKALYHIQ